MAQVTSIQLVVVEGNGKTDPPAESDLRGAVEPEAHFTVEDNASDRKPVVVLHKQPEKPLNMAPRHVRNRLLPFLCIIIIF